MNIKLMVIAHGDLGRAFLRTAEDISGRRDGIFVREVNRSDGIDKIKRELDRFCQKLSENEGLLILADMLGGTPSNVCIPLIRSGNVEVITGINFPMLVTAIHKKDRVKNLEELAEIVSRAGKEGVVICSKRVDK